MLTPFAVGSLTGLLTWHSTAGRDLDERTRAWWAGVAAVAGVMPFLFAHHEDGFGREGVAALMLSVLVAAAVVDAHLKVVPNLVSAAAAILAVCGWVMLGAPVMPMLLAVALATLLVAAYLSGAKLGAGDVKLLPSVALVCSSIPDPFWGPLPAALFGALLLAAIGVWSTLWTAASVVASHGVRVWRAWSRPTVEPLAPAILAGAFSLLLLA